MKRIVILLLTAVCAAGFAFAQEHPEHPTDKKVAKKGYTVDDHVITFVTDSSGCPDERSRYRIAGNAEGLRLHFLDDSCQHAGQDIVFARMR